MAFVVEDGTGLSTANSYAAVATFQSYYTDRGLTPASVVTADQQSALVRATAALDATYGGRYPGYRKNGRDQALGWPRSQAYDSEDLPMASDAVPAEIVEATCEAALRELTSPGSMMPDLARGGQIQSLKAGSVAITYGANASATTSFQLIDGILAPILTTGSGGGLFGNAVRG